MEKITPEELKHYLLLLGEVHAIYNDESNLVQYDKLSRAAKEKIEEFEQEDKCQETDAEPELKTAEAQKTEQDQSVMNAVETPAEERKVISYKEVELPNGDIEMVPVYEDDWKDGDS